MLVIAALQILNKRIKNKDYGDILKQFKDYALNNDFDIKNEKIDNINTINIFSNFSEAWINQELNKKQVRNFKKCLLLRNIFIILKNHEIDLKDKLYIINMRKIYEEEYRKVVDNIVNNNTSNIIENDEKEEIENKNNDEKKVKNDKDKSKSSKEEQKDLSDKNEELDEKLDEIDDDLEFDF